MVIPDFLEQDRFYLDLENDKVEWIQYHPNAVSGGQFEICVMELPLPEEAWSSTMEAEEIFSDLRGKGHFYTVASGSENFGNVWKRMKTEEPFAIGCTFHTLGYIHLATLAKRYINSYCQNEFGSDADFSDLRKIGIGYTTITDAEYEVQAYANLLEHRTEVHFNRNLVKYQQHPSFFDMVHFTLHNLEFDSLMHVPDWIITNHERSEQLEDLAVRLTFFMKEHDPKSYSEIIGMGEPDADMVSILKAELKDTSLLLPMISGLEAIIKEGDLSGADRAKCYDMMTDLYHLYAEEALVPVFDRETEILHTALDTLGIKGYELSFDSEGICMSKDGQEWHNEDIYQHLADMISVDACREFLAGHFMDYIDFKDLASHYGVRIGTKLRNPPLKFPERNDTR